MKSDTTNSNRDISRQNKASTVIDASLHLLVAQDLIKEMGKIACDVLEKELELSPPTKRKLEYIAKLATNAEEVVHIASYKDCKSSSYVGRTPQFIKMPFNLTNSTHYPNVCHIIHLEY